MPMFRKKPVVIVAKQLPDPKSSPQAVDEWRTIAHWCGGQVIEDALGHCILIDTLEGQMRADPGDWIIKGVKGEFYPCKPDIFAATYEPADA